ncbi:MAG: lysophospholipid acyltransferase family protein [Planctomycetaceae bacterium]
MSSDLNALVVLGFYLLIGLFVIGWQIARAGGISVWLLSRAMQFYSVIMCSQRIHGICPLPEKSGALIVANHRSPVDPLLIYCASLKKQSGFRMRVIGFLTAQEYCSDRGILGWIIRTARSIPVDREHADMASAKEALRRLRAGEYVGIFPEGRLNLGSGLLPFNTGVAWLALRGEAPTYPVFVRNSPQGESMVASYLKRQPADVLFGPALDLSRWKGCRPTPDVLEELTAYIRQSLADLEHQMPPLSIDSKPNLRGMAPR